ncbi:patatin-like phospholipase family protein [Solemya elarraichensis gill symbiont]|uniref:PNPLA domain-containing protein n=1 Tax=Solemya elarraichensis gill symbiont TaxID=1918949 RepID=A0A1T2LBT0_9GAMM|nr:patatin-like phospholipase family protein [Solemya elarraichensis gill symbiont]OOZ42555.1 hypothetical protein BOW52_02615 [Solemya elarraichensis gill symbiont]
MKNKSVSLVLGSGGARGLAHIGVIRCLEENGFSIESISGSSMGALIGGIYAAGKLEDYAEWVCALEKLDVIRLLDPSFTVGAGIFRGEKIISVLRDLIGEHQIESLPISFTAVASDIERQREVWLKSGPLFDAIRASIAIPTLFTPVYSDGRMLLDGGLVNPVPIAPTVRDNTQITVAVDAAATVRHDLVSREPPEPPQDHTSSENDSWYRRNIESFLESLHLTTPHKEHKDPDSLEIISRSIDTMQALITRFQLAAYHPDLLIKIPIDICMFYEFHKAEMLIDFGYRMTQKNLDRMMAE